MHLQKGQLVRSKAGRDRKRTFAVLAQEGQLLLLSDGATRPLAHPTRKKLMHLTPTATVLHSEALPTSRVPLTTRLLPLRILRATPFLGPAPAV